MAREGTNEIGFGETQSSRENISGVSKWPTTVRDRELYLLFFHPHHPPKTLASRPSLLANLLSLEFAPETGSKASSHICFFGAQTCKNKFYGFSAHSPLKFSAEKRTKRLGRTLVEARLRKTIPSTGESLFSLMPHVSWGSQWQRA